jgi:hypothetical protein
MSGCPSLNRGDQLVPSLRLRMVPAARPLCRLGNDDGLFARMASVFAFILRLRRRDLEFGTLAPIFAFRILGCRLMSVTRSKS